MFAWLNSSLPPPRVLATTQLTHDGTAKAVAATDGSRLYINVQAAASRIAQVSITGGETSLIPTPLVNSFAAGLSPDHTQLLVISFVERRTMARSGVCLCPLEPLAVSATLSLMVPLGRPTATTWYFARLRTYTRRTPMEPIHTSCSRYRARLGSPNSHRMEPGFASRSNGPIALLRSGRFVRTAANLNPYCRDGISCPANAVVSGCRTVAIISS